MDILEAIASRTSVRQYADEAVDLARLEAVRRAGEQARALTPASMTIHLVVDGERIQGARTAGS